jgi:enoyl-CoA hydratase/carnithine racemase
MTDCISCDVSEAIATITLNRPEAANALNHDMRRRLKTLVEEIAPHDEVRAVIVTGQGSKAFAAGSDVRELRDLTPTGSVALSHEIMALQDALADLAQPTIAAIQGACLGGGFELALACDIRVAADNSRFGLPEIRLGITPGGGGTVRLRQLAGPGVARHLCLTGEIIDSRRAYELGLVSKVVAAEKLAEEARALARHLAGFSMPALAQIKRVLRIADAADPDTARRAEAQACSVCFGTFDQKEGMTAFLEKRPPAFRGN